VENLCDALRVTQHRDGADGAMRRTRFSPHRLNTWRMRRATRDLCDRPRSAKFAAQIATRAALAHAVRERVIPSSNGTRDERSSEPIDKCVARRFIS
jgi:hypothetical protein